MGKIISIVTLVIGTVIGAGFASGREIVTYFGQTPSPIIGLTVGVAVFLMTFVFLSIGAKVKAKEVTQVNALVLKNTGGAIMSVILLLNCAVSFSAMLAGTESLFSQFLPLKPFFSIVIGLLSALTVTVGIKGLKRVNLVLVPMLIVVIVLVTLSTKGEMRPTPIGVDAISSSLVYTAMNMLLACGVLTTVRDLNKKQILSVSLITAVIVGLLLAVIARALSTVPVGKADMPLVALAKSLSPWAYIVTVVTVLAGIFTTMLTAHQTLTDWLNGFISSRIICALSALLACFILSLVGFKRVVDTLYPLFGIVGCVYFLACLLWLLCGGVATEKPLAKRNCKIHKRGKYAKNNGRSHYEIKFEHLTTVNDKISKPCSRNEVLAHNSSYPRKSDVDFKHA